MIWIGLFKKWATVLEIWPIVELRLQAEESGKKQGNEKIRTHPVRRAERLLELGTPYKSQQAYYAGVPPTHDKCVSLSLLYSLLLLCSFSSQFLHFIFKCFPAHDELHPYLPAGTSFSFHSSHTTSTQRMIANIVQTYSQVLLLHTFTTYLDACPLKISIHNKHTQQTRTQTLCAHLCLSPPTRNACDI